MHRRNEGTSSSSSLLSGGSSTVPQCLSKEYEDYLRRSHEDFQPLPRIFTKNIFTPEEPGALYKRYQLKANQTPIKWINLMHGDQSPKTLNFQQQKKQLKPCETYKQSYNAKPKYALDNQPKTTTGQTKEKMFEFKTKKPKESSSNWKPWHKDWDAITSNHSEYDAIKDDGKYRYNRKLTIW
ncbi:hypothetical protein Tco_1217344 [Tanacetum coccineum]